VSWFQQAIEQVAAMTDDEHQVLCYVRAHDGCTAREVAVQVFQGPPVRSFARVRAHRALTGLEDVGMLRRVRPAGPYGGFNATSDTWHARDNE
jgi:hypothetical protein